jgi:hypothetical protein
MIKEPIQGIDQMRKILPGTNDKISNMLLNDASFDLL